MTRVADTVINVLTARLPTPSSSTVAGVITDKVLTSGAIFTRRWCTVIDVVFTSLPFKTFHTKAAKGVDFILLENREH